MRVIFPWLLALGLASCKFPEPPLPPVQQSGELVVITRNSPTTFFEDASGNFAGLEHDLVELFARELGVKVKFVVASQFNEILPALQNRRAHMAAAGLTVTPDRQQIVRFGPPYQTIQQQVVYNSAMPRPRAAGDLIGKNIEVVAGSSYVERLLELRRKLPALQWKEVVSQESEELLAKVSEGTVDCTVVDSNILSLARNYYPNLAVAFTLGPPQQLAWAFPRDSDLFLLEKSRDFFDRIEKDGTLKRLIERYYGHIKRLESDDVSGFLDRIRSELPRFRRFFHEAHRITGIDWRLLAALGYQESHWDPLATSPTGVRGLMMLTEDTADRLKVTDRLDPAQSIIAGSRYLAALRDSLPGRIPEPDRTWMALAAYNVGLGHLEDARILAQRLKLNPDSWMDLKKTLPLLSQLAHYRTLKHGYARGGEPVIFVESIRNYFDILAKFEKPYTPPFATPGTLGD
jgi:membrane-bound lytic murein transglycosylase F